MVPTMVGTLVGLAAAKIEKAAGEHDGDEVPGRFLPPEPPQLLALHHGRRALGSRLPLQRARLLGGLRLQLVALAHAPSPFSSHHARTTSTTPRITKTIMPATSSPPTVTPSMAGLAV